MRNVLKCISSSPQSQAWLLCSCSRKCRGVGLSPMACSRHVHGYGGACGPVWIGSRGRYQQPSPGETKPNTKSHAALLRVSESCPFLFPQVLAPDGLLSALPSHGPVHPTRDPHDLAGQPSPGLCVHHARLLGAASSRYAEASSSTRERRAEHMMWCLCRRLGVSAVEGR